MTTPCLRNLRRCVTEFCRACTRRKIVAIKGASGSRPLIEKAGSKTKTGARLWIVGVDIAKGQIFARFPHASSARPPPVWYEQATSELAVIRYVRGPPCAVLSAFPASALKRWIASSMPSQRFSWSTSWLKCFALIFHRPKPQRWLRDIF